MLVLLFVALRFILRDDVLCLTLCYFVLMCFSPFSITITSLGGKSPFRTFVRFVLVWFCWFPLPLGVWKGLRFVALPGPFPPPSPPPFFFGGGGGAAIFWVVCGG